MNIYFACSITGGREFESVYQEFVAALVQAGHQIPTAHLVESGVGALEAGIDPSTVYTRDVDWIRACDVLIAEVSVPSHGVGYEIAFALGIGKPVLALYQQGRKVSKMITGNPDMNLQVQAYQDSAEGVRVLREFLARHLK
ncbi:MAG: nucleoside 2-deoxyribosyltransferase [Chloroflexota bacterium]